MTKISFRNTEYIDIMGFYQGFLSSDVEHIEQGVLGVVKVEVKVLVQGEETLGHLYLFLLRAFPILDYLRGRGVICQDIY